MAELAPAAGASMQAVGAGTRPRARRVGALGDCMPKRAGSLQACVQACRRCMLSVPLALRLAKPAPTCSAPPPARLPWAQPSCAPAAGRQPPAPAGVGVGAGPGGVDRGASIAGCTWLPAYVRSTSPEAYGSAFLPHATPIPGRSTTLHTLSTPSILAAASAAPATPAPTTSTVTGPPSARAADTACSVLGCSAPAFCSASTSVLSCSGRGARGSRCWVEGAGALLPGGRSCRVVPSTSPDHGHWPSHLPQQRRGRSVHPAQGAEGLHRANRTCDYDLRNGQSANSVPFTGPDTPSRPRHQA